MQGADETSVEDGGPRGELYEDLCLIGVAQCLWLLDSMLDVFSALQRFLRESGLSSFVFPDLFSTYVIEAASVLKSVRLRREIATRSPARVSLSA